VDLAAGRGCDDVEVPAHRGSGRRWDAQGLGVVRAAGAGPPACSDAALVGRDDPRDHLTSVDFPAAFSAHSATTSRPDLQATSTRARTAPSACRHRAAPQGGGDGRGSPPQRVFGGFASLRHPQRSSSARVLSLVLLGAVSLTSVLLGRPLGTASPNPSAVSPAWRRRPEGSACRCPDRVDPVLTRVFSILPTVTETAEKGRRDVLGAEAVDGWCPRIPARLCPRASARACPRPSGLGLLKRL